MVRRFVFDIQFFAQERTEPATSKRRSKVRNEGKVCQSKDLTAAVEIMVGLFGLWGLGNFTISGLVDYIRRMITLIGEKVMLENGWFFQVEYPSILVYFRSWLILGFIVTVCSTTVIIKQIGWHVSFEPFKINFGRMNPISGLKKIISLRALVELFKGLLKASLFCIVIYAAMKDKLPVTLRAMQIPVDQGALALWDLLWNLAMRLTVMLLVIAVADYMYQKWEFEKSIRMSKQEIKEEFKQMEGDPQIKSKIRQKQRELAKKRMMSSVPTSDVVITNPTTLAIALAYERDKMSAPQVTAKGKGLIAQRIREIAEEHGVPIIENKPLARALYESAEIGEEVPENLYRGVAEILAMVYKLKK